MVGGSLQGTPASSTTKTGRYDIAEIFLKVALNTNNQDQIKSNTYLQTFQKGNEEAINTILIQFYFK
jgi:hypothetical protein